MAEQAHPSFVIVSGIFTFLALILSLNLIWKHLQHWEEPRLQVLIVRILIMVPIYSVDSFLSIVLPGDQLYFDTIRDCYEAYVIYSFFMLLIRFLEGESNLLRYLDGLPRMKHPWPLCCFTFQPGAEFLHLSKQMILQFVIIKPIDSTVAMILNTQGLYDYGSFRADRGYLWITFIDNASIMIAMYYLILFYIATSEPLQKFRPIPKFLCIKGVVFFSFWQSVLIAGFQAFGVITSDSVAGGIEDMILCIEMFLFSLAHIYAFGHNTYKDTDVSASLLLGELKEVTQSIVDPRQYPSHAISFTQNAKTAFQNFGSVANQGDIVKDTYNTFIRHAKRYFDAGEFLELDEENQKKFIVMQGAMLKLGEKIKSWKERYFLLISRPSGLLYYPKNPYEDFSNSSRLSLRRHIKMKEEPIYFIDFNSVTSIDVFNPTQKVHKPYKHVFSICTEKREWIFACASKESLEEWTNHLNSLWDQARTGSEAIIKESIKEMQGMETTEIPEPPPELIQQANDIVIEDTIISFTPPSPASNFNEHNENEFPNANSDKEEALVDKDGYIEIDDAGQNDLT